MVNLIFNPKTKNDLFSIKKVDKFITFNPIIELEKQHQKFNSLWSNINSNKVQCNIKYNIQNYQFVLTIDNNPGIYHFTLFNNLYDKMYETFISYHGFHISKPGKIFFSSFIEFYMDKSTFGNKIIKLIQIYKKEVINIFFTASLIAIYKTLNSNNNN